MSLEYITGSDPRKFFINGHPVTDVISVDEDAGEMVCNERHWSSGDLITDVDGSQRKLTLRGKVKIEGTLPEYGTIPGDPVSEAQSWNWNPAPTYHHGPVADEPCPMCGQKGCPPSGCDKFCCLRASFIEVLNQLRQLRQPINDLDNFCCLRISDFRYVRQLIQQIRCCYLDVSTRRNLRIEHLIEFSEKAFKAAGKIDNVLLKALVFNEGE